MSLPPLTNVKKGLYEHYKGNRYRLVTVARHSETLEEYVVYEALYGAHETWIRPLKMFFETVVVDGIKVPRFRFISPLA